MIDVDVGPLEADEIKLGMRCSEIVFGVALRLFLLQSADSLKRRSRSLHQIHHHCTIPNQGRFAVS